MMNSLKKIDVLFFSYFVITTLMLLFSGYKLPNFINLLFVRAIIIISIIGLIYLNSTYKNSFINLIRDVYPIILSGYFYSETVFYNKLFFNNIDPILINLETSLFGVQPSLKFSECIPNAFFSEIMYLGYFSFYILILGFTLFTFFKDKKFFSEAVFLLSASLYLFYFIFGLLPSEGPQFYFSEPDNILPSAYFFDKIIHFIQKSAEQPTGAFPSSHVGVSLIILMLAKKRLSLFFKIACPFTILLILSTVYIKAHYLVDVIAAIIIAPLILFVSKKLKIFFKSRNNTF